MRSSDATFDSAALSELTPEAETEGEADTDTGPGAAAAEGFPLIAVLVGFLPASADALLSLFPAPVLCEGLALSLGLFDFGARAVLLVEGALSAVPFFAFASPELLLPLLVLSVRAFFAGGGFGEGMVVVLVVVVVV